MNDTTAEAVLDGFIAHHQPDKLDDDAYRTRVRYSVAYQFACLRHELRWLKLSIWGPIRRRLYARSFR